jgi:hypothetical protein
LFCIRTQTALVCNIRRLQIVSKIIHKYNPFNFLQNLSVLAGFLILVHISPLLLVIIYKILSGLSIVSFRTMIRNLELRYKDQR